MAKLLEFHKFSVQGDISVSLIMAGIPHDEPVKAHSHYMLEISVIMGGKGECRVGDNVYKVEKGDIFLFNNTETHSIQNVDPDNLLVNFALEFDPRFIWTDPVNQLKYNLLSVFYHRDNYFGNKLDKQNPHFLKILKMFENLADEFANKAPFYESVVKADLLKVLTYINRYYDISNKKNSNELIKHGEKIKRAMEYISEHYRENLTLKDMADLLHINSVYFSQLFTMINGIGFKEYIIKKKVSEAAVQLISTDKKIIEIAGDCGFNSLSNFYYLFKKVLGLKPSEYRDMNKQK